MSLEKTRRRSVWAITVNLAITVAVVSLLFGLLFVQIRGCDSRIPLSRRCCVLITLDTCRADALGCYGSSRARTPNLDGLAERGCLFERCLTPVPITLPAHCSLFTGKYPLEHGVRLNGKVLDESRLTLAEVLSEAGIQTAAFVGSYACSSDFGLSQGYATYDDRFPEKKTGGVVAERTCLDVNAAARKWLAGAARKPFFLWVHYFDPHAPHEAPLPYAAWFPDQPYDAEVAFVDRAVGQLLDAVVEAVGEEGLMVVVVGDHGEGLDDHNEKEHGHLLFDTTVRVPLILAGGPFPRGRRISEQVCLIDLASAIQEWLLQEIPLPSSGSSLKPLVDPRPFPWRETGETDQRFIYGETIWPYEKYGWSPGKRVTSRDWVLILDPRPRLFRMDEDPGQENDLSSKYPEKVQELTRILERAERKMVADMPAFVQGNTEGLKQLGYLGMDRLGKGHRIPWGEELPSPTEKIGVVRFERRGLAHKAADRREDAKREFQAGLQLDPNNLELLNELGLLHMEKGDHEQALRFFRRLDEVERGSCLGLVNQGLCFEALGNGQAAREAYKSAINKDSSSWKAWFNMARLSLALGDLDSAKKAWEMARDRAPMNVSVVSRLGKRIEEMEGP